MRCFLDAPRRGTSHSKVNFVHPKDAGGVLVELVEPAAEAHCRTTHDPVPKDSTDVRWGASRSALRVSPSPATYG